MYGLPADTWKHGMRMCYQMQGATGMPTRRNQRTGSIGLLRTDWGSAQRGRLTQLQCADSLHTHYCSTHEESNTSGVLNTAFQEGAVGILTGASKGHVCAHVDKKGNELAASRPGRQSAAMCVLPAGTSKHSTRGIRQII